MAQFEHPLHSDRLVPNYDLTQELIIILETNIRLDEVHLK